MTELNNPLLDTWLEKWFVRLLIAGVLVNASGLLIPILEPDGALYATIAKTIARTGDFVNLRVEGHDWLDKPHFPFWITAISFRIFGDNAFAYKFPALLFWAAGAWYTWRLARCLYGPSVARLSVLLYLSAAHLVISNNDVRAEPYLTGLVIGAVFHFYRASRVSPRRRSRAKRRGILEDRQGPGGLLRQEMPKVSGDGLLWGQILAGSLLAACAMMTKGPFVLITIGAGFVVDWALHRNWAPFGYFRWWVALVLIGLFIMPELYCLYQQFDRHPEKTVFGHTGVSGIRFFFWDSQFGRFFNTGPIKGSGDPFFYFHTLLWAFLPWSLILYAAIGQQAGAIWKKQRGEAICFGAAVISFLIFSLSRFQLPHYLNMLFPFFAMLAAAWLYRIRKPATLRVVGIMQGVINLALPLLLLGLTWSFGFRQGYWLMAGIVLLPVLIFLSFRGRELSVSIGRSYGMALLVYCFINLVLYPQILVYQAGTAAGEYLNARTAEPVYTPEETPANYSLEFYAKAPVYRIPLAELPVQAGPVLVFIPAAWSDSLRARGYAVEPVQSFPNFHISQLTGEFLNARTRASVLDTCALVRVQRN